MNEKKWFSKQSMILFILLIILVSPILVYASTFGIGLWQTHDDWAQMGNAIGGIYTPILSLLTIVLIARQVKLQHSMHEHSLDTWMIDTSSSTAREAIKQLVAASNRPFDQSNPDSVSIRQQFVHVCNYGDKQQISSFITSNNELYFAASTYFSVLDGLRQQKHKAFYNMAYTNLRTEASSLLKLSYLKMLEQNARPYLKEADEHF